MRATAQPLPRARRGPRGPRSGTPSSAHGRARRIAKRLRQRSALAMATIALLLMFVPAGRAQEDGPSLRVPDDPSVAVQEATGTLRVLWLGFYALFPKLLIAALVLVAAWAVSRAVRFATHRLLADWKRADATAALANVAIWLVGLGAALSIVVGDPRALVGSVGLTGLALSWALQTPIESFTGWVLNSFRGYYRVGDRILVGEVFGDVYRIDLLNTTLWEAGGAGKSVQGAQPTGALVTFPNAELLRVAVTNYTREFPWVWDEIAVAVGAGTDLAFAADVALEVARGLLADEMRDPVATFAALLADARLTQEISDQPQVFVSGADFWSVVTVRYLVPARQRRIRASRLHVAIDAAFARPEHRDRILLPFTIERQERQ